MSRNNFEADCARKKEYLIRSLFQDVPPLSPVPEEEEESYNSSHSRILRSPIFRSRKPSRPVSPLPPLIIEREPNRHDEPEEHYMELEKKVLRIYRKLFIDGESDISSSDISDGGDDAQNKLKLSIIDDDMHNHLERSDDVVEINSSARSSLKRTIANDDTSQSKRSRSGDSTSLSRSSSDAEPKSISDDAERVSRSPSSNPNEDNEITTVETSPSHHSEDVVLVTVKADVHREATNHEFIRQPVVVHECANNVQKAVEDNNDSSMVENNADIPHRISSDQTEIIEELEVMRDLPIRPSFGSLLSETAARSDEHSAMSERARALRGHTLSHSSHRRETIDFYNMDFNPLHRITTPLQKHHDSEEFVSIPRRFSINSRSSSSSEFSSICRADVGTQTSIQNESMNREIPKEIFIGTPQVFRLCSCADHCCNNQTDRRP